jgi:hypothetical protein
MNYQSVKEELRLIQERVLEIDDSWDTEIYTSGAGFYSLRVNPSDYQPSVTLEISVNGLLHSAGLNFPFGSYRGRAHSSHNLEEVKQQFWKFINQKLIAV